MLGGLDPRVRDRIVAETRGNPLALLEVPRERRRCRACRRILEPRWRALSAGQIEEGFVQRIQSLPAADPTLVAARGRRTGRRCRVVPARCSAARHSRRRTRTRRSRRRDRVRAAHALSPSADALGGLSRRRPDRASDGPPRTGRGDRSASSIPTVGRGMPPTPRPGPDDAVAAELETSAGRAQSRGGVAGRGRLPRARGDTDVGSGASRIPGASPPRRPNATRQHPTPRTSCSR